MHINKYIPINSIYTSKQCTSVAANATPGCHSAFKLDVLQHGLLHVPPAVECEEENKQS